MSEMSVTQKLPGEAPAKSAAGPVPRASGGFDVRDAELRDLPGMVACHRATFVGQLMSELGPRWLRGLYRYYIEHPDGLSLVAVNADGRVLGFCVGGEPNIRQPYLYAALFRYAPLIAVRACTNPIVRARVVGTLTRPFRRAEIDPHAAARDTNGPHRTPQAEAQHRGARLGTLLSIGVMPEARGGGVASALIEAFARAAAQRGFGYLELGVYADNDRAIAFYRKHGWEKLNEAGGSAHFGLDLAPLRA